MRGRTRNSTNDRNEGRVRLRRLPRLRPPLIGKPATKRSTYLTSYLVSVPLPLAACSRWLDAALDREDL